MGQNAKGSVGASSVSAKHLFQREWGRESGRFGVFMTHSHVFKGKSFSVPEYQGEFGSEDRVGINLTNKA